MKLKAMGIIGEYKIEDKYGCIEEDDESSSFKECQSDDSEDDPSFDPKKEVQSSMSRLSLTRKSKQRITKVTEEEGSEEDIDAVDIDVPELGEEDQKSFEAVQKKIEAGQVEKLKLDQCKVYLRKYGLRLTGNKEMLIRRIKEYLDVLNGGGERKHPVSSFVLNCKGDACTGDVVMFEQNVYEMFNIASRSANGHPCGTRIIAGRIVKESYGAVKQQHTFTIEVLWSKGVKPLPPLHPLLIKGRNLYRLKTMRQKWENEGERQKILAEKHSRGTLARSTREVRIQEREMRKMLKANRAPKLETLNRSKEENMADNPFQSLPISSGNLGTQPQEREKILHREQTSLFPSVHLAAERLVPRQHLASVTPSISFQNQNRGQSMKSILPHHQFRRQHSTGMPLSSSTCHNQNHGDGMKLIHSQSQFKKPQSHEPNKNCNPLVVPSKRPLTNMNGVRQTSNSNSFQQRPNFVQNGNSFQNQCFEQQQLCKFYAQGRCYYGDRCKYLHEQKENH